MSIRTFVPAAVTGLLLSAAFGATRAAAQQVSLASDSIFIQRASSVGLLQVKLGKLAQKKGSSTAVVEFGKRMVTDYSKANEELAAAAKQAAFPGPVLMREHQQIFNRINETRGSSFDKTYMSEMVKQHSDVVRLFQQESESGRVQSLKQLASRMLPALQQRLALATQTAGSVGVNVAALSPEANQRSGGN
jgi:putative membrane protein